MKCFPLSYAYKSSGRSYYLISAAVFVHALYHPEHRPTDPLRISVGYRWRNPRTPTDRPNLRGKCRTSLEESEGWTDQVTVPLTRRTPEEGLKEND